MLRLARSSSTQHRAKVCLETVIHSLRHDRFGAVQIWEEARTRRQQRPRRSTRRLRPSTAHTRKGKGHGARLHGLRLKGPYRATPFPPSKGPACSYRSSLITQAPESPQSPGLTITSAFPGVVSPLHPTPRQQRGPAPKQGALLLLLQHQLLT